MRLKPLLLPALAGMLVAGAVLLAYRPDQEQVAQAARDLVPPRATVVAEGGGSQLNWPFTYIPYTYRIDFHQRGDAGTVAYEAIQQVDSLGWRLLDRSESPGSIQLDLHRGSIAASIRLPKASAQGNLSTTRSVVPPYQIAIALSGFALGAVAVSASRGAVGRLGLSNWCNAVGDHHEPDL